jgi:drug/metabolite transporter (DMT)-like permease
MTRSALGQWLDFVLLAAIWGSSFLFMRVGAPEFGPIALIFVRVAIAAALMLLLIFSKGLWGQLRSNLGKTMFVGLTNSAIPFTLLAYSALSVTAGFNSILNATAALWTSILAALWLQERLTRTRWLGVLLGFLGVVMLVWDRVGPMQGAQVQQIVLAVCAGLAATFCYGYSNIWTKKHMMNVPSMVTTAGSQIGATLALLPLVLFAWPEKMPSATAWGSAAALGVICTAWAYILYFRLIQQLGSLKAAMVTYLVPVFAIFWGWIALQETVSWNMLLAMAVTVLGTAMATGILKFRK